MTASQVRVRDNVTQVERTVQLKAYNLIKNRYTPLAFLDKDGNEVGTPGAEPSKKVSGKKKVVEPVANELPQKRGPGRPKMTPEQIAAKRQDMAKLNAEAIERVKKEAEDKKQ